MAAISESTVFLYECIKSGGFKVILGGYAKDDPD